MAVSRDNFYHNEWHMSRRLFDVLETVGASEYFRTVSRSIAVNTENMTKIHGSLTYMFPTRETRPELHNSVYFFGSFIEGTTTPGLRSDIDVLLCRESKTVFLREEDIGPGEALLITDINQPGYVELVGTLDGVPIRFTRDGQIMQYSVSLENNFKDFIRHGPAVTDHSESRSKDFVLAMRCQNKHVPILKEWACRLRHFGWPHTDLVRMLSWHDCFLVNVGVGSGPMKDLQWRISFSIQERKLMFSLNPTQYKTYVSMKLIKKGYIEPAVGEESITSFQCKTCLFHAIEQTPPELWTPDNLLLCIRTAFMFMYMFLLTGHCPNYFNHVENLFHKSVFIRKRQLLSNILKNVLDHWYKIPYFIKTDKISHMMEEEGENVLIKENKPFKSVADHVKIFSEAIAKSRLAILTVLDRIPSKTEQLTTLHEILYFLENEKCMIHALDHEAIEAFSHVLPYVHLQLATVAYMLSTQSKYPRPRRWYEDKSEKHFTRCLNYGRGLSTALLMKATILLHKKEYGMCAEQLLQWKDIPYLGQAESCPCRYLSFNYGERQPDVPENKILEVLHNSSFGCFMIGTKERQLVPPPLQYEASNEVNSTPGLHTDVTSVDPVIYYHTLMYMSRCKLHETESAEIHRERIKCILYGEQRLFHKHTAYNILGWMYKDFGHLEDAADCWTESLKIQPQDNGASWHLAVLLFELHKDIWEKIS